MTKKPWPTRDVMEQIYENQLWGEGEAPFYSGEGSHLRDIIEPYIREVRIFLSTFETPISVADLGCGDFNVGSQLIDFASKYVGVDIVQSLIEHNKEVYKNATTSFQCLDLAKDKLPKADCALARQVLQHLSNKEIQEILNNLSQYRHLIITEHIPKGTYVPNLDIISGQGTRLKKRSGVDVLAPPFNFNSKFQKVLGVVDQGDSVIKTVVYELW